MASDLLTQRAYDGAALPSTYTPTPAAPHWQPDPVLSPPADPLTPQWGDVGLFALPKLPTVPGLPSTSSTAYANALAEVYGKGYRDATLPSTAPAGAVSRTDDESEAAYFWSYDDGLGSPVRLYNQIVRQVIATAPADPPAVALHRHARLLALANMAMADAAIACWRVKFDEDYWRPYQGIRASTDPNWLPLGRPRAVTLAGAVPHATPNFPAYVSGHSTIGAALFGILKKYYTGVTPFGLRLRSDETPTPRTFAAGGAAPNDSWGLASKENSLSRIWLGVHWKFDAKEGESLGQQVADGVWDNKSLASLSAPSGGLSYPSWSFSRALFSRSFRSLCLTR